MSNKAQSSVDDQCIQKNTRPKEPTHPHVDVSKSSTALKWSRQASIEQLNLMRYQQTLMLKQLQMDYAPPLMDAQPFADMLNNILEKHKHSLFLSENKHSGENDLKKTALKKTALTTGETVPEFLSDSDCECDLDCHLESMRKLLQEAETLQDCDPHGDWYPSSDDGLDLEIDEEFDPSVQCCFLD